MKKTLSHFNYRTIIVLFPKSAGTVITQSILSQKQQVITSYYKKITPIRGLFSLIIRVVLITCAISIIHFCLLHFCCSSHMVSFLLSLIVQSHVYLVHVIASTFYSYKLTYSYSTCTTRVHKPRVADLVIPISRQVNRTLWGASLLSNPIGSNNVYYFSLQFSRRKYSNSVSNVRIYEAEYKCHKMNFVLFEDKCMKNGICKEPFLGLHKALIEHSARSLIVLHEAGSLSLREASRELGWTKRRYSASIHSELTGTIVRLENNEFVFWPPCPEFICGDPSIYKNPNFDRCYHDVYELLNRSLALFYLENCLLPKASEGGENHIGLHVALLKQMMSVCYCNYELGYFLWKSTTLIKQSVSRPLDGWKDKSNNTITCS